MNPAFTTSGKIRTAAAFDLALAAAGFCATSCCKARRDWLVKSSADAVPAVSNVIVTTIEAIRMFLIGFIWCYSGLVGADSSAILVCLLRGCLWDFGAIAVPR